jgi:RNA-directed DNA polymerase
VMHGREKSDPAIVAKKSANAVAQAAEWLEPRSGSRPRAGTEENANWQSTCRAQDRESVSQALERVRTVAQAKVSTPERKCIGGPA